MIDIVGAAAFTASLFLLFKAFGKRNISVLHAIVVNYFVAFITGSIVFPYDMSIFTKHLLLPALVLGFAFITVFSLTAVSTQRAGVAATTIASKMSLVLTVAVSMYLYEGAPTWLQALGIAIAIISVVLASWRPMSASGRSMWFFPLILFLSNAFIDSFINHTQEVWLDKDTMSVFPTIVFLIAGVLGVGWLLIKRHTATFRSPGVWIGGTALGVLNFGALYFVVRSLAESGLAGSSVFPLINIGVVFFASLGALVLFQERLSKVNWIGLVAGVAAMVIILLAEQQR